MEGITDEREQLYRQGMSDRAIARAVGRDHTTIRDWRKRQGLPSNGRPLRDPAVRRLADAEARLRKEVWHRAREERERRFRQGYAMGLGDKKLAQFVGVSENAALNWRQRRALPSNNPDRAHLSPEARAARMLLYSFGYSDARIAKEQRVRRSTIERWRAVLKLPANRAYAWDKTTRARRGAESKQLIARIKRALPAYLSPADRDDAAGDLFMAVMSGKIPIGEIEKRATRFGNTVINAYASKFGPRSLNEELGDDGDGFTMIDMIADERSSSWLEEMGATVW